MPHSVSTWKDDLSVFVTSLGGSRQKRKVTELEVRKAEFDSSPLPPGGCDQSLNLSGPRHLGLCDGTLMSALCIPQGRDHACVPISHWEQHGAQWEISDGRVAMDSQALWLAVTRNLAL